MSFFSNWFSQIWHQSIIQNFCRNWQASYKIYMENIWPRISKKEKKKKKRKEKIKLEILYYLIFKAYVKLHLTRLCGILA